MTTFRAALHVLWRHKNYILIYLIGMSVMMLALGASAGGSDAASSSASSFTPQRASVAVINRDGNTEDGGKGNATSDDATKDSIGIGLRDYMAKNANVVTLSDSPTALEDAVATNQVDLIIIVPRGYTDRFLTQVAAGHTPTGVRTVTSYASGRGSLATMQMNGYFNMLRLALLGDLGGNAATTTANESTAPATSANTATPTNATNATTSAALSGRLPSAIRYTVSRAQARHASSPIAVQSTGRASSNDGATGFGLLIKMGLYPIFTALTICVALLVGVFNRSEVRRRMLASPQRVLDSTVQQFLACLLLGAATWVYFCIAIMAIAIAQPIDVATIGWADVVSALLTLLALIVASSAFGYMVSQFTASMAAANGIGVTLGLVLMFTSGMMFDPTVMPTAMVVVGKLLPGWWYCVAIDNALGIETAAATGADLGAWGANTAILLAYAMAFICVGLAVGRYRRLRPAVGGAKATRLAEVG